MSNHNRGRDINDDSSDAETLAEHIIDIGHKKFLISRQDIISESDPGTVISSLIDDGLLTRFSRGRYIFGLHTIDTYVRRYPWLLDTVFCLESALWIHNGVEITPFPIRVAGEIYEHVNNGEIHAYREPEWPSLRFEVKSLEFAGYKLKAYGRERTLADLIRCDVDGRRKALAEEFASTWWEKNKLNIPKLEAVAVKLNVINEMKPLLETLKKRRRRIKAKTPQP